MPQIDRPVKDTALTIVRPIALSVIRQMCEACGINPRIPIQFPNAKGVVEQPGSNMESADNTPTFASDELITIAVENKPGFEGGVFYDSRHKSETLPIFSDTALGLHVAPIVSNRELFITVTYRTQDKVAASTWVEYMRSRIEANQLRVLHRVQGYIIIPNEVTDVIEHIYALRENKAPYGEDLGTYFTNHADERFSIATDQGEKNNALIFNIPYTELYGWFENPNEPDEPERGDKGENYTARLVYRVQFDEFTALLLRYPIIVHNQYINQRYLFNIHPTPYDDIKFDGTATAKLDGIFGAKRPALKPELSYGIRIPRHDDWLVPPLTYAPHTLALYTVLIVIDETNPPLFMNLRDVSALDMPEFVWDYIKSENDWMLMPTESLFQFSLYLQDDPYPRRCLDIEDNLDIVVKNQVNLRYQHHARFGIYLDLKYLSEAARKRLQEHGRVIDWWIKKYRPDLPWTIDRGIGDNNDYVSDKDMSELAGLRNHRAMDTVETLCIQTRRA